MFGIVAVIASYLLGAVTFSFVVGKIWKGIDVRQHGSGNAGATNTLRVLGVKAGVTVLLLDIAKGVFAVSAGKWIGSGDLLPVCCGIACILGHNWPVYFRFKGGKGIATTVGVMAALAFIPSLLAGIAAIVSIAVTRYVSIGSLLFTVCTSIFLLVFREPALLFAASLIVLFLAFLRHRRNIAKLISGQENKIGSRKSV